MLYQVWTPSNEISRKIAESRRYDWLLNKYFEGTSTSTHTIDTVDGLIEAELGRATTNFLAASMLCEKGFGLAAHQIARTHVEAYAGIKWAIKNPEIAPKRYSLWLRFASYLYEQRLQQNPVFKSEVATSVDLDPDELRRAKTLFNTNCTAYWTGHQRFLDLVRAAGPPDEGDFEYRRYKGYIEVIQTWSDRLTHAGPIASLSHIAQGSHPNSNTMMIGASEIGIENALLANGLSFIWILYTVFRRNRPNLEPLLDFAGCENWHAWLTPTQKLKIATGGRCPCDEGLWPYRECHGRYRSIGPFDPLTPPWGPGDWPPHAYEKQPHPTGRRGPGG